MLVFASDYPHWHHGDVERALLRHLSPAEREQVLHGNAARLYRLESDEREAAR
jgi:predicted TIM-barrel fold metal-dependent hydrolase